ncbi:hypothetical protein [Guptibacillus hwajinpoensis]
MSHLENKAQKKFESDMKRLKELAFFLELEGYEYHVTNNCSIHVEREINYKLIEFKIVLKNIDYSLSTEVYDEDAHKLDFELKTINRMQAKTIVDNMLRIENKLTDVIFSLKNESHQEKVENQERTIDFYFLKNLDAPDF